MRRLAVALLFFVVACATSTEDKIVLACQTYASTLTTLAVKKAAGDLSADQIATVNNVREILNPICQEGKWDDVNTALKAAEEGVLNLAQIKGDS